MYSKLPTHFGCRMPARCVYGGWGGGLLRLAYHESRASSCMWMNVNVHSLFPFQRQCSTSSPKMTSGSWRRSKRLQKWQHLDFTQPAQHQKTTTVLLQRPKNHLSQTSHHPGMMGDWECWNGRGQKSLPCFPVVLPWSLSRKTQPSRTATTGTWPWWRRGWKVSLQPKWSIDLVYLSPV